MHPALRHTYYYSSLLEESYSNPELTAWVAAGTTAGHTLPSAEVLTALDALLGTALETGTVASRMKTGYIFHAGSKDMAKLNLKDPATFPLTEVNTVSFSEGNGVKSASSSYFSQPFKSDQYAGIESDLTVIQYISESSTTAATQASHGVRTRSDVATYIQLLPLYDVANGRAVNSGLTTDGVIFVSTNHKGLYIQLNNGTTSIVFKDGTKHSATETPSTPNISQNRLILAMNNDTGSGVTPVLFYLRYVACDFLFDKFSDADAAAFNTAFNTYKTATSLP